MTVQPPEDQARIHVSSRAEAISSKIKETNYIKRVFAVCFALLVVVVVVIVIHGPQKRHSNDAKSDNKLPDATSSFDLKAYQQQIADADRRRARKLKEEAENPNRRQSTGIMPSSEGDDTEDISYVKQAWKQPMIWDVPQSERTPSTAAGGDSRQERLDRIHKLIEERQRERAARETALQERLKELRQREEDMTHQRKATEQ